jgi:long-chain fatty acid transport protein
MKQILLTFLMVFCFHQSLISGGFLINDHSARSVSMGFSTIANINDPSALFYNPAAIVNAPSVLSVAGGVSYIMPGSKFTGITTLNQQNTTNLETWNFIIPNFYIAWKTPLEGLSFGACVFVPFGLGTRWPSDWVGRHSALETYLQNLEINPNLAYKFSVADIPVSVSAGFGYVLGNVELKKYFDNFNPEPLLDLKGDGNATTFNFGLHLQPMDYLKIGASYRHNSELEYSGDAKYENIQGLEAIFQNTTGKTKIKFPMDFRFGIAYNLMEDLWIEAGIAYVGWSSYDTLAIEFEKGPGNPTSSYTSKQARNYKDVFTYRLSGEYTLNENITLRCGLFYDQMPVDADFVEPVLPEGNRLGGSVGIGYKINNNFSVDFGYTGMYGLQTDVKNNSNQFNGLYNTWANILALSINFYY